MLENTFCWTVWGSEIYFVPSIWTLIPQWGEWVNPGNEQVFVSNDIQGRLMSSIKYPK